jgi:hypothetical protein
MIDASPFTVELEVKQVVASLCFLVSHLENTVDWDHTIREIVTFTKNTVKEARADGVVVGLSS